MKNIYLTAIFTCLIVFSLAINSQSVAQETQCDSINNELTSKFRFLGEWNADGTPDYMDPVSDEVSQALIDFVNETVPESVNFAKAHESYFGAHVQLNTELLEASKVYLTMVHEGAGWKNTLGYYTYDINNPPQNVYDIDSLVILFPNVSQPNVIKPGDKVLLGEFPENTGIGYFLIAQGWVGDNICIASHIIFTHTHLNTFTTEEFRQQTILLSNEQEDKFLLGFEDIIRPGGDNDFNDAVFYITAEPGAIDTTDIPKIPTAMLSGDTTLCDVNDPAIIHVDLSGQSPWTIVYNDGTEDIEISDIQESVFTFETTSKDSITLISVQDKNQLGIVDGKAVISLSQPKAILDEEKVICIDNENAGGFLIGLEGTAPFSLTFKIGDEEKIIENISKNQIELAGAVGEKIELISMSDQYCNGEIIGRTATVQSHSNPNLLVDGSGALCGGALSTTLDLNLEGEGPWIVNYSLNDISTELIIEPSEYQLEVSDIGVITFNSIEDENCFSPLATSFNIDNSEIPTAAIVDMASICGEDEATVNIAFTGEGPWKIQYEINGESMSADSNEELLVLNISQSGVFELIGVTDANCENTAEGNLEIEFYDIPTAFISGDTTLCQDFEATIQIELTGIAPFTIVYTDGETETTVTSESTNYEFSNTEFKTYTLISVNDANCSGMVDGSATISDGSEGIQVEIDAEETSCFGEDIDLALIGDTDNLSVVWTTEGSGVFSNTDKLTTSYSPGDSESGIVVFFAEVSNGCAVKTISTQVTIIDEIDASFDFSPDKNLLTNTQITFTPSNSDYDEYFWDFGDDNTSKATIASNEYINGDLYTVELTAVNSSCEGKGSAELEVLSKDELYVPNAFNPNAINSENQVVKVYGNNVDEFGFSFKIVNRWGKVMYETSSFNEANSVGWNGINNNNREEQEMNVFTYLLKGQFLEGDPFERTGTITQVK